MRRPTKEDVIGAVIVIALCVAAYNFGAAVMRFLGLDG